MTPKEINTLIADITGWTKEHRGLWVEELKTYAALPNYWDDLNECHQLMQWAGGCLMNADQWELFGTNLLSLHPYATLTETKDGKLDLYDLATFVSDLTSRQICEAFLKAIDRWKE